MIKGVDVSYCQEGISFSALKQAGVKFAIIRAGFSTKKDVTMDKFVSDCKANGIDFGFYWYSYAMSVEQAQAEADKCIEVIKGLSPTYPVFFDMEEKKQISGLNTDTRTKMAIAFCENIRQAGFKPGIYANPSFMENYYDKQQIIGKLNLTRRLRRKLSWTRSKVLRSRSLCSARKSPSPKGTTTPSATPPRSMWLWSSPRRS